jgi:hypothetical protein
MRFALLVALALLSAAIVSWASSGSSVTSGSFLANHLYPIVAESAVRKSANSGHPNCSIKPVNAASVS